MKLNQYAVYRVDQTSSGKDLWRLPYDMVQKKKLQIRIEFYRQQRIEKVSADDTAITIWNRRKDSFEVNRNNADIEEFSSTLCSISIDKESGEFIGKRYITARFFNSIDV